jgi:hypothetical protein
MLVPQSLAVLDLENQMCVGRVGLEPTTQGL